MPNTSEDSLQNEEPGIDLSMNVPNKKSKNESGIITDKNKDSVSNKSKGINITLIGYIILILFLTLGTVGFFLLKHKSNIIQRPLQLNNISTKANTIINKPIIKIGRAPDNDLVINSDGISRYHAIIRYDRGKDKYFVKDLGSTNGTSINGKKIKLSDLKNGDIINFYKVSYKIKL